MQRFFNIPQTFAAAGAFPRRCIAENKKAASVKFSL